MKNLVFCALFLAAGCGKPNNVPKFAVLKTEKIQSPQETFETLLERYNHLHSILNFDLNRDDKLGTILLTELKSDELQSVILDIQDSIKEMEGKLQVCEACSESVRQKALETNDSLDFYFDAKIREADLRDIVAFVRDHAFIDPRLMRCELVDENTLEITTGDSEKGYNYIARREAGKWIIRSSGFWIS